ncbi:MAG: T9SS type A sorting domain-containing protein [candidate division Zixibacteria bacterium]|nr:T9SS type A sorting domain-containing protein [candidate division Zixibacteria bacterium]
MRTDSITCKALFVVLALAMLAALPLTTLGSPLYHNFVVLPELTATNGQAFVMPVRLYNEAALNKVIVPLLIRDVDFLNIDSISFVGSRFGGLGTTSGVFDNGTHTMLLKFDGTPSGFLPPGNGEIANIYLKVAPTALAGDIVIDTTVLGPDIYLLQDTNDVAVEDYFVFGLIHIVGSKPIIQLQPTIFNFVTYVGVNPEADTLHITNLGSDPLNWQITHQPSWLTLSALFGTAPSAVVLTPDVASYPVGVLVDSIAVNDDNALVKTEWAYVNVTILENPDVTRCLALHQGWNLISWNVDTPDDDIETIIKDIKGCIDVVLGFEQGGATYDPYLSQFSTLTTLDHLHGYWFRMNCDTTLCVTGTKVAPDTPIDLEQNWNLVSYLPDDSDSTQVAISSVLDKIIVALGFDNGGLTFDPAQPGFATLKEMKPGLGYWLKTDAAATLIYPGSDPKASIYVASRGTMKAFPPAPGVTPTTEWIDLFGDGITLDGTLIPTGTVLAAYDENGHLCGQATVGTGGRISFTPVYRDDKGTTTVEGPDLGGSINLAVNGIPVQQSYTFSGLGDRIRLTALTSLSKHPENLPRQFGLAQNYPNPFNPGTSIDFSLPVASRATVDVYNVVGEKVTTLLDRFLPAGRYSVSWDGANANGKPASSGMYFYRLKAGEFTDTKKMMLVK